MVAAINVISETADDIVALDDLCPLESGQIHRQQEELLIHIAWCIGDGTVPARMKGNKSSKFSPSEEGEKCTSTRCRKRG